MLNRAGKPPPWPSAARLLGAAALAAAAVLAFRVASRARRELIDFAASDARLASEWTAIPRIAGAGELRLHARVRDAAASTLPPVVLVHGFGIGTSYLVPLAARLAEHAPTYAPELPGHGLSDHDARPLSIPELADALAAWMDARPLRSALLVGHSLGCQVAAEVAARRPELVAGLVLVGPTSDPAARTVAQTIWRGIRSSLFDRPTYIALGTMDYRRAGARVLAAEMRQMVSHRVEDVLPRVAAPARVARGGRDRIVPHEWAEAVARLAGAPPPTAISGWGHAVQFDDPHAVASLALELARAAGG